MGDRTGASDELPFAEKVEEQKANPLAWKSVVKKAVPVVIGGVAIYLVFPKITEVLASWPRLSTLEPVWFALAVAFEIGHFVCTFALHRLALRTKAWFSVVTAELAGNAISGIMPGGAAVGAAVQVRMLVTSGQDSTSTVGGLAAFSLLGVAGLLALPVIALPVILIGAPTTNRGLVNAAIFGAVGFVLFVGLGALLLATDAPLRWCGRIVQRVWNWVLRKRPLTDLDRTLIHERNGIREVLGKQWWRAMLLSAGRLAFDYLCLLAAIRATGSHPRASLILVAYAVAGIVGMIPITPGGLGVVEASLTGFLVLAGVDSGNALLATLTYRLASYWLPLAAGPFAYGLFKLRYRGQAAAPPSAALGQA